MKHLHIDIETYSEVSIADCGVYKYAMDPSFEILLVAYAIDDKPTKIIDMKSGDGLPDKFIDALTDPTVTKHAHNATFERVCFSVLLRRLGIIKNDNWLDPDQWECSMIKAARCGLPLSLKQVGEALHLEQQKMAEGKNLVQLFCTPHEPRKNGLYPTGRALPEEFPDKWETFKQYCVRDVDVEREIESELSWYEVSPFESFLYGEDQRINDYGALIDVDMARSAVAMDSQIKARLAAEAVTITGLDNPNSPSQLKAWIGGQLGIEVPGLTKADLPDLVKLADEKNRPLVKRILQIRAEMGKTSNAKYAAMLDVAGKDGRVRGMTQFYGTRTGRWAGRFVQMQNLPQNHIDALDTARQMLVEGDYDSMDLTFGNVPDTMSQLIRTAFVAPEGHELVVCDFSAIEARVLAWMAGEDWVLDTFRHGGDIYCATASQMFHVPVEKHGQNAYLRQRGKVAVLALGYQGGVGALDKMGGAKLGMTEDEETETVNMWRRANPNIVSFWGQVEKAAKECIVYKMDRAVVTKYTTITFHMEDCGTLSIELPSGRRICYPEAELHFEQEWGFVAQSDAQRANGYIAKEKKSKHPERYVNDGKIRFKGMNQTTRKWEWIETYGGKITENITQAIARDCLAFTMMNVAMENYNIVFHIHDELVVEAPLSSEVDHLDRIQEIFKLVPSWATGLPLKGAGYRTPYYKKD